MELPKIPYNQLTPALKEIVGQQDLEFDSIVDVTDVLDIDFNSEEYKNSRIETGKQILTIRNDRKKSSKKTNQDCQETS